LIKLHTSTDNIYAAGIDLGGTFIKGGIVSSTGKILKVCKLDTFSDVSPQKVISQIEKAIEELLEGYDNKIEGIGIGSPGIVREGIVYYPPNFKNWKVVDLRKIIEGRFHKNTIVNNDAKCAGLAELAFGHGKKIKNFLFLTLGTGIGGAIIINGKMYTGEKNGAGEFGQASIKFDGPLSLGGTPGAVEAYLGRRYFLEDEKAEIKKLGNDLDFKDLSALASKGNKIAKGLFKRYGFYLGVALTNYFNLMDMRTAVLSGGISNAYKHFIGECNKTIQTRSLKTIKNEFRVLQSKIHNDAGVLGAAALILNQ
jgi:glucokinase